MYGKFRSKAFSDTTVALVSMLLLLSSCAESTQSTDGLSNPKEKLRTTASFTPPEDCQPDTTLAAMVGASQACIQRFSPTHEFVVKLTEYRARADRPGLRADSELAKLAVEEQFSELLAANRQRAEGTLQVLEEGWVKSAHRAPGADHCAILAAIMEDRHVPGHEGKVFLLAANALVCARADKSDNTIQIVQLTVSERSLFPSEEIHEGYPQKRQAALGSLVMK